MKTVLGMTMERDDLAKAAGKLIPIASDLQRLSPMLAQRLKAIASECESEATSLDVQILQRARR